MKNLNKIIVTTLKTLIVYIIFNINISYASEKLDIVVPFPPGGTVDILARQVQKVLIAKDIDANVIYKPGAHGIIAMNYANQNKDSILMMNAGFGVIAPLLNNDIEWDISRDFKPVTMIARDVQALAVLSDSPWNSADDLIRSLNTAPRKLTHGNASDDNRLAALLFLEKSRTNAISVNYRGAAEAKNALLGGHVDFIFMGYAALKPLVDSNKIKILGVANETRLHPGSDIKTLKEQNIDLSVGNWFGIFTNNDSSDKQILKLNQIITTEMKKDKSFTFLHQDLMPVLADAKQLGDYVQAEKFFFADVLRRFK